MSQHFLLTRRAKSLTLAQVFRMSEDEAETLFRNVRWPETAGAPVCPNCGGHNAYECRRPNGSLRFRCRACKKDFTVTSGTLFASHKLPLRSYLAAIAIFCNEVKGKAALAMSRDLGLSYKAAFVLCHKLREAMGEEMKGRVVGGDGKVAKIDAAYFGGYVKPANLKVDRIDWRRSLNQSGKRKAVIIIRERNGNSVPAVFQSESAALGFIKSRIAKGTLVQADESPSWDSLHAQYEMKRIDHSQAYSFDGACTNMAEEYSLASAAPRPATTTASAALTSSATLRSHPGGRTTAASRTGIKFTVWRGWRYLSGPAPTLWVTGSVTRRHNTAAWALLPIAGRVQRMSEISFNVDPRLIPSGNVQGEYVRGPSGPNALPPVMNRKLIGETAGKVVRLTDIYRVPVPVARQSSKDVNTGLFEVSGADGVLLKFIPPA